MENSLKLITVNIEGDNHLDRIIPFLKEQKPDVVCMQEIFASDVPRFTEELGMQGVYAPLVNVQQDFGVRLTPKGEWGLLLLTRNAPEHVTEEYYFGTPHVLPVFSGDPNCVNRVLLSATVHHEDQEFTIATTHFTWSPGGQTIDLQHEHLDKLFTILEKKKDLILCGDFNAPRGKEIFSQLAEKYKDNIPSDVTTTLDQNLHRVSGLKFVVDVMFSTPEYTVEDVQVVDGVSDHKAVVGVIRKNI